MLTPSPVPMPEPVVGFFMDNDDLRAMFLAAGLPADQVDDVLDYFQTFGRAAKITSLSDYETATALYRVMDDRLAPDDLYSPAARYVISLGEQISEWDKGGPKIHR